MNYARVGEIVQRAVDELVAAGATREDMVRHMGPVEAAALQNIADNSRRQLLLNLDYKTADLAARFGVCERTIRNWRKEEIDRQYVSATVAA